MIRLATEAPATGRLIHKALVLGADLALQTGFLNRASNGNAAFQLYPTLGVGIGVSRSTLEDGCQAVLQLWSLPLSERHHGITDTFMKGHRGAVVVLRPDETDLFEQLFFRLSEKARNLLMIVLVGVSSDFEQAMLTVSQVLGRTPPIRHMDSVTTCLELLATCLSERAQEVTSLPLIALLDEDECPAQMPILESRSMPPSSREEIEMIRQVAEEVGVSCTSTHCMIELDEGTIKVELSTGETRLESAICRYCLKSCARFPRLCIVGMDSGWASEEVGNRALLTMAKIYGLATGELPDNIRMQLHRSSRCSELELHEDLDESGEVYEKLMRLGYASRTEERTLQAAAQKRVREGRLSLADYDTIMRGLRRMHDITHDT